METEFSNKLLENFRSEVYEQPDCLARLVEEHSSSASVIDRCADLIRTCKGTVYLIGMGGSETAVLTTKWCFTKNGVNAVTCEAGEILHYMPDLAGCDDVFVMVSASGLSAEIVRLNEKLPSSVARIILTDGIETPLCKDNPNVLKLCAGQERATSSKTYLNTVGLLDLLASCVKSKKDGIKRLKLIYQKLKKDLEDWQPKCGEIVEFLGNPEGTLEVTGRGPGFGVGYFGSLVIRELFQTNAMSYPGGTYRHWNMLSVGEDTRTVVLSSGKTRKLSDRLAHDIVSKGGRVLLLHDDSAPAESQKQLYAFNCGGDDELEFMYGAALAFEMIAINWAQYRKMKYIRKNTVDE